jgi:hypothetical protein
VKGLMMVGLTLLNARAMTSAMAWAMLDFMVNLNEPCWTSKSQAQRMVGTIGANLSSLGCPNWHKLNKNSSTLQDVKEMSHLLVANIRDKQSP